MKIIKVIVDELPDCCARCFFSVHQTWRNYEEIRSDMFCHIEGKILTEEDMDTRRPDWCPLERDKDIVNQEYNRKFYADQQALTELYRKAESEDA